MTSQWTALSSDGVEVAVHDLGGSGPPVLLAHGTGLHALVWRRLAAALPGQRVALDLRAHGDTPPPAGGVQDWAGFGDDVLAAIDVAQLRRPYGVGHSMGAAALVRAELTRPGTFRGLYLYEPIILPPTLVRPGEEPSLASITRRRRGVFGSPEEALANFASKPPMSSFDPGVLRDYVEHGFAPGPGGRVHLKCRPEDEARIYELNASAGVFDQLGDLHLPVIVATGHVDAGVPAQMADEVAQHIPGARLEHHEELSHFGPLERPDALAVSVRAAVELATP